MFQFKVLRNALTFSRLYTKESFNAQYRLISIDSTLDSSGYALLFEDNYSKKVTSLALEQVFLSSIIDRFDANDAKYIGMIYARSLFERRQDLIHNESK